jgi:hypothetical protein
VIKILKSTFNNSITMQYEENISEDEEFTNEWSMRNYEQCFDQKKYFDNFEGRKVLKVIIMKIYCNI